MGTERMHDRIQLLAKQLNALNAKHKQKEEHLETAYAAAIGEIHREYRSAVEARAKALESDVSAELRAMVTEMATRRRGNGLPTSGGSYRDPPEPPGASDQERRQCPRDLGPRFPGGGRPPPGRQTEELPD